MAQTVSVLVISNDKYQVAEITGCIPDKEDIEQLAIDNELYGDIECEYVSYNIGEGESYTDTFFTNEELIETYEKYNDFDEFEKAIETTGYEINRYESGHQNAYAKPE